jgi:hypothetical protein
VKYTVYGATQEANVEAFYGAHTDITGCFGSVDPFNGWSPSVGGSWASGPYVYGAVPYAAADGLYEGFLGACVNHGGYQPCFQASYFPGNWWETTVKVPASPNDPRVTH